MRHLCRSQCAVERTRRGGFAWGSCKDEEAKSPLSDSLVHLIRLLDLLLTAPSGCSREGGRTSYKCIKAHWFVAKNAAQSNAVVATYYQWIADKRKTSAARLSL